MRITFQLRFHTRVGQELFLTGNHALLGDGKFEQAVSLRYLDDQRWQATLDLSGEVPDAAIVYNYVLREPDGSLVYDWGADKVINPARFMHEEILIIDAWNHAGFFENAFSTEPFRKVLLKGRERGPFDRSLSPHPGPLPGGEGGFAATHVFRAEAPLLREGQTLCLLGSGKNLANWDTSNPILLNRPAGEDFFSIPVCLGQDSFPVSYKYGVYDLKTGSFVRYEDGSNRTLNDPLVRGRLTIINDGFAVLPSTTWRGAGVAIPVFSLRSAASFGVGEFADLKLLADWCARVGLKMIQILPVNDTTATHTWLDSYPYAAISAFALHPQYISLSQVAEPANRHVLADWEPARQRLNSLDAVDYEEVVLAKLTVLKQICAAQAGATFKRNDYKAFFERNQRWLVPYAVFCQLRDEHGTADASQWPKKYGGQEIAALAEPGGPEYDGIAFYYFVQFHLHLQLKEASEYAHSRGVILKGDIAIGVGRHSADTWQQPELYRMDFQAGAPPDAFAVKGQNWGFPTYNWPRMKDTGFEWWKHRFAQMGCYFDAFRIDHILGFFRIWSVPAHAVEGILGHFVPALPVATAEFSDRGVAFDRERFVKPWITDAVLGEIFGPHTDPVKKGFLRGDRFGHYDLKPEFATQRQVEAYFAALEATDTNQRFRQGLYDLISNVILLEGEPAPSAEFHFRFAMETTSSFRALDPHTQSRLRELYVDYFFRRQEDFWMREGLEKLPALKRSTNMLVCGEDLGLVPSCVPEVMRRLGLLSLEIQRMPKDANQQFFRPAAAPYLSVVTPSTHDMSTLRGWWTEDGAITQRFFNEELKRAGPAPEECDAWIVRAIVLQHLASPAMWSVFQVQDLLGMDQDLRRPNTADERINVPANPRNYWRYRMHLTLEDLLAATVFNEELADLIQRTGR